MPDKPAPEASRIAELKRRLEREPSPRLHLDLVKEYHEAGLFEEAALACTKAVRSYPSFLSARVLLGKIHFDMGQVKEAREEMETVLAQAPDNLTARRVLAEISSEEGDLAGALDRYRALLAFSPSDKETRERIAELEKRLESGPPDTEAPAVPAPPAVAETGPLATPTLAEIYLQQGLTEKAAEVYREILKGDPANAEARERLLELDAARPAPPDPAAEARQRKIKVLNGWLESIRGGTRV